MKHRLILSLFLLVTSFFQMAEGQTGSKFFPANDHRIQYTGRIDFTNPMLPRFWQPGVYMECRFTGSYCAVIVNDEQLWGKNQNYLELVVDGKPTRLKTKGATDTIVVGSNLSNGVHTLLLCKNTEANIGYVEVVGIRCNSLLAPPKKPARKIECIGNSITCGTGSDQSEVPCGKGVWQDQHNAYLSYGAVTARALKAQYHLSSVSGIGLMHSCCGMNIVMPPVFDKISMRNDTIIWDFNRYQPDVVTICLGQNDGIQDSTAFCDRYRQFLQQLRQHYPKAQFICITSPMADAALKAWMVKCLPGIVQASRQAGDSKVDWYAFSKQYSHGCDFHPDLAEHQQIANELTRFIRKKMRW